MGKQGPDDSQPEFLEKMFEEILKMINKNQIKVESIIAECLERGILDKESFDRIYRMLTERGKAKGWI